MKISRQNIKRALRIWIVSWGTVATGYMLFLFLWMMLVSPYPPIPVKIVFGEPNLHVWLIEVILMATVLPSSVAVLVLELQDYFRQFRVETLKYFRTVSVVDDNDKSSGLRRFRPAA